MPFFKAMPTSDTTHSLDIGRLLRMQAMVTQAAEVEATRDASRALVHAYLSLRAEMLGITQSHGLEELQAECERLFPLIEEAEP